MYVPAGLSGQGVVAPLTARTPARAIARLDVLWKEHFAATNVECPYCQYLQDHADPGSDAAA